jgi:CRISPR-associated protein Cas2
MWLFAMFDLPVKTRPQRRDYTRFRKLLLREGFSQLQFSVYARYCMSEEASNAQCQRIAAHLPPEGQVRMLAVTERQFGKQRIFWGPKGQKTETPPPQLMMF